MANLNVIVHVMVSIYRLVLIRSSPQFPTLFRNDLYGPSIRICQRNKANNVNDSIMFGNQKFELFHRPSSSLKSFCFCSLCIATHAPLGFPKLAFTRDSRTAVESSCSQIYGVILTNTEEHACLLNLSAESTILIYCVCVEIMTSPFLFDVNCA